MTVQNTSIRKAQAFGGGSNTAFPFSFKVFAASDLLVTYMTTSNVESTLALGVDYAVSLNSNQETSPGGTVTIGVAPTSGTTITISSALSYTQNLSLSNPGYLYLSSLNDALDRIVILTQQLYEQVSRSLKIPISGIGSLTSSALVFGVDSNGSPVLSQLASISQSAVSSFVNTLLGISSAANFRSNIGAAQSGSNSDITALTGLTTPLATTKGGTGANSASSSPFALKGANTDITSLSSPTISNPTVSSGSFSSPSISNPSFSGSKTGSLITSGTSVASTTGTSIDFTGIPSWAKRITVMLSGVSTSATSNIMVQIGANTTPETSGYAGSVNNNNGLTGTVSSTGFLISQGLAAADTRYGIVSLQNITGSTWVETSLTQLSSLSAGDRSAGAKTITGNLGVVRITTVNGTDTFDAGQINILYE